MAKGTITPNDEYIQLLDERVKALKKEGTHMYEEFYELVGQMNRNEMIYQAKQDGIQQGIQQGMQKGMQQGALLNTLKYVSSGMVSKECACKDLNLSMRELNEQLDAYKRTSGK